LKPHILDTGNVLCPLEILARPIFSPLSRVIHKVLGHFTKCSSFFTEVDDNTAAAFLSFLDSFFHAEDEIWAAGANVGSKYVAAVTFVVYTEGETNVGI
jgi:hypothetical protein